MKRRRVLAALGGVAGTSLAGCVGDSAGGAGTTSGSPGGTTDPGTTAGTTPGDPSTLPADAYRTLTYDGETDLERSDADFAQRAAGPYYLAVLTDRAGADALAKRLEHGPAATFLADVDFDREVAVVLQNVQGQSTPDFSVTAVRRTTDALALDVEYPGQGGTSDVTEDVLLSAIPRGEADPRHATVTFSPMTGDPTTFSTLGRYGRSRLADPRPIVLSNRDCSAHSVHVTATVDGELVYASGYTRETPPGSVATLADALGEGATYRLAVRHAPVGSERRLATASTTIEAGDGRGILVEFGGDGAASISAVPTGSLPTGPHGSCRASDVPYESSDPAGNLRRPAAVEWANRSGEDRSVRILVRDGSATVLDRTVEMAAHGKGNTRGLVARRGVYPTELRPEEGQARTVEWDLRDSRENLQVIVGAGGDVEVGGAVRR